MPMLKTSQAKSYSQVDSYNTYDFAKKHKKGWTEFWEEMGGDMEKIVKFAEDAGIDRPKEWFNSLHRFLFDVYCGDEEILDGLKLKAASKDFQTFLGTVLKNHQDNPKDKWWYINKGMTEMGFIAMLERAGAVEQQENAIAFINARVKDMGNELYSEFLLSKAGYLDEMHSVASGMNKKAYEIEKALGKDIVSSLKEGDKVYYYKFASTEYEVVEKDEGVVVVIDDVGRVGYVTDPWNLTIA